MATHVNPKFNIFASINCHSTIKSTDFSKETSVCCKNSHKRGTPVQNQRTAAYSLLLSVVNPLNFSMTVKHQHLSQCVRFLYDRSGTTKPHVQRLLWSLDQVLLPGTWHELFYQRFSGLWNDANMRLLGGWQSLWWTTCASPLLHHNGIRHTSIDMFNCDRLRMDATSPDF